ncbi:MAG TPA: tRNA dihydrouridine(20/20a) synthase DusA [Steroidobacteraceae bacterium]|nr:tRNA dihydrouridine(20/20a) synthase DusA [Steroidobacteraceae bacterium]
MKIGISIEKSAATIDRRLSVAPMMDWTDRHCRYFLRGFSPRVRLYTEMITAAAVVRGDQARLLRFSEEEKPLALQLGGSDPALLAAAARAGAESGYDEINFNCGCPSDRVQAGAFGACLMQTPALVADCVAAMRAAVKVPVTVKMRIGVLAPAAGAGDVARFDSEHYVQLRDFTATVAQAGCEHFIVHARRAVLGGLSPRENRAVPPLRFDVVQRLAREFSHLWIGVNGGLRTAAQCETALLWCDGVMLGREAYHRPAVLTELHRHLFDDGWTGPDARSMLERMAAYTEREVMAGERVAAITRHMLGLCAGSPGARHFRQCLSEGARTLGAGAGAAARARRLMRQAAALCAA